MPPLPAISSADFDLLATATTDDKVAKGFAGKVKILHSYLNSSSAIKGFQADRKAWIKPQGTTGFENFGRHPRHWYTYHHGGRNEAQFNIGMYGGDHEHVRIGLGFEGTTRQGGDPSRVAFMYTAFIRLLRGDDPVARDFRTFVSVEGLEVEFWNLQTDELELVKSSDSLDFLLQAKASFAWIFIGRLLRRGPDAETLADPSHFTATIDRVFANIRPIWRVTNQRGYATAV